MLAALISLGLGQKSKTGTSAMEIASRPLRNPSLSLRPTTLRTIRQQRREVR
ncbi:hypothetical protein X777_09402 [Ooceraea biroi]|uniref:Uncharacterized protein n=1 Tax=Ooceraea biroi TaxID=2015173 RepID=A0A026X195_OOCBI|nr:hypothetical protein X777_09402 [Ooceraea biroi]